MGVCCAVIAVSIPAQFLRIEKQGASGAIILMHVGEKSTADALPAIIADLQGRGFRLVTVSTLLGSTANPP